MRKVKDLMARLMKGEADEREVAAVRNDLEAMVRRVERVTELARDRGMVELSPYMKSLLKIAREPEAASGAVARKAANF